MAGMFYNCFALTSFTSGLSNFNTSVVTSMTNMFNGCRALTTLDISNFDLSACTTVNSMFYNCKELVEIDAGRNNWNNKTYTNDTNMFYGASKLPNYNVNVVNSTNARSTLGGYFKHYEQWIEHKLYIKEDGVWKLTEVYR